MNVYLQWLSTSKLILLPPQTSTLCMTMSAEELRRQKESDSGQGGTGSQSTVAILKIKVTLDYNTSVLMGGAEHFPFL